MQAAARQTDYHVARLDGFARNDTVLFDDTHAKTSEVIVAWLVEIRQDGRLAPNERAIGFHATVADAFDNLARQRRIVLRHGEVIEKDEWFGAGAEAVIDRHRHQVYADRVVLAN